MPLVKNNAIADDPWQFPAAEEAPPAEGPVAIGKARFLSERDSLAGRSAPLGLVLQAGEGLDGLEDDIGRFALIALAFPKYTDGRSYSVAHLLRERYGFKGELRATGNVLRDQIPLMLRCGFDAFEVTHEGTLKALLAGKVRGIDIHYQPAATERADETALKGARPWLRVARG